MACVVAAASVNTNGKAIEIGVTGRANANVSMASSGSFAGIARAARTRGGATDICAATSRDGGRSFKAPVRVNQTAGEVSVSGEQPPRIALPPGRAGDPSVVVMWTAKSSSGTRLVSARSSDGGQSFGPAASVLAATPAAVVGGSRWRLVDRVILWPSGWITGRCRRARLAPARAVGTSMGWRCSTRPTALHGRSYQKSSSLGWMTRRALMPSRRASVIAARPRWRRAPMAASSRRGDTFIQGTCATSRSQRLRMVAEPSLGRSASVMTTGCWTVVPRMVPPSPSIRRMPSTSYGQLSFRARETPKPWRCFDAMSRDGRRFTRRQQVPTDGVPRHPQIALGPAGKITVAWDEQLKAARRIVIARGTVDYNNPVRFAREVVADEPGTYPAIASVADGSVIALDERISRRFGAARRTSSRKVVHATEEVDTTRSPPENRSASSNHDRRLVVRRDWLQRTTSARAIIVCFGTL